MKKNPNQSDFEIASKLCVSILMWIYCTSIDIFVIIDIVRVYFDIHSFKAICFWIWRCEAWAIVRFHSQPSESGKGRAQRQSQCRVNRQCNARLHCEMRVHFLVWCKLARRYCQWTGLIDSHSRFLLTKSKSCRIFHSHQYAAAGKGRGRGLYCTRSMNWPATALYEWQPLHKLRINLTTINYYVPNLNWICIVYYWDLRIIYS